MSTSHLLLLGELRIQTQEPISLTNITDIVVKLMQLVSKYNKLSGIDKKNLVLETIQQLIKDSVPNDTMEYELLENCLLQVVPIMINHMIAIDKNQLIINARVTKCWKNCFV